MTSSSSLQTGLSHQPRAFSDDQHLPYPLNGSFLSSMSVLFKYTQNTNNIFYLKRVFFLSLYSSSCYCCRFWLVCVFDTCKFSFFVVLGQANVQEGGYEATYKSETQKKKKNGHESVPAKLFLVITKWKLGRKSNIIPGSLLCFRFQR